MFRTSGLRDVRVLLCTAAVGLWAAAAPAQFTQFAPLATTLAPAAGGGLPADLKLDVLNVIPADALGFVTAHHILETKKTVENVMQKLQIPFDDADSYDEFTAFLESLQGWDQKGMHAVAMLPRGDDLDDTKPVLFVPVTNYAKFAESMGAEKTDGSVSHFQLKENGDGNIALKANYALIAEDDDGAELLERVLSSKRSLGGTTDAVSKWMAGYQVAGVMTRSGVEKVFDEAIKGLEEAQKAFGEGGVGIEEAQLAMVVQVFGIYDEILRAMRDEVTHFAVGAQLDETAGLKTAGEALFKAGGKYAAATKEIAPLPADALNGLPEGDFFLALAGTVPSTWMEKMMDFSMGMSAKLPEGQGGIKLTDEQRKELTAASKDMLSGMKMMSFSMNDSGTGIFGGAAVTYRVDDAAAFVKRYRAAAEKVARIAREAKSPSLPEQEIEERTIDGLNVIVVTSDMSKVIDQAAAQTPQVRPMLESIFGNKGKVTGYFAPVTDDKIVVAYDEAVLKKLAADVKAGKPGLAGNVKLQKTAAMLPSAPQAVTYLSVGGLIDTVKKITTQAMAAQGQAFPLPVPPFPDAAPIGLAGKITPTTLEGHFVVPMDLMEATRDFVLQIQAMFGGLR